jgi:hypothetical protein
MTAHSMPTPVTPPDGMIGIDSGNQTPFVQANAVRETDYL